MSRRTLAALALVMAAHLALPLLSAATADTQSVTACALAQSLQQDIQSAQALLANGTSPWQDTHARPQAEPMRALGAELPGQCLWLALKPLDAALRRAYDAQRRAYIDKDAGIIERREAKVALDGLFAALRAGRSDFPIAITRRARLQALQLEDALRHNEYHACLCLLWALADGTGLWDRQAALECGADSLAAMRAAAMRRTTIPARQAEVFRKRLECLDTIIEQAMAWQPAALDSEGQLHLTEAERANLGLDRPVCAWNANWAEWTGQRCAAEGTYPEGTWRSEVDRQLAKTLLKNAPRPDGAVAIWRDAQGRSAAGPVLANRPLKRLARLHPPKDTKDLVPCPTRLRAWQYTLGDFRYGWVIRTHVASGRHWHPHGDWRDLQPEASWPGAGGSQTAGGL